MGNVPQKLGAHAPAENAVACDDEDRVAAGHVDRKRVGALTHELIAELLEDGLRSPSPERISATAARLPGLADVGSYRMAVRQRILTSAALYFRLFMPPAEWVFEGAELRASRARFDLVWRSPAGVIVDELKTGRSATRREIAAVREQAARETAAGTMVFGEQFLGVRVVSLGAPRTSFFCDRDGRSTLLDWSSR